MFSIDQNNSQNLKHESPIHRVNVHFSWLQELIRLAPNVTLTAHNIRRLKLKKDTGEPLSVHSINIHLIKKS